MPPSIPVVLTPHDPVWAAAALVEAERIRMVLGPVLRAVHHIGSTAIPGLPAKPILDLMPEIVDLAGLDACRGGFEALGYVWWGEYGLPARRYCTRTDPVSGRRLVHLHCFPTGSTEIERHLAFRDHLRAHPEIAASYAREKSRCRDLYGSDSHAYGDCKGAWIQDAEARALAARRAHAPTPPCEDEMPRSPNRG